MELTVESFPNIIRSARDLFGDEWVKANLEQTIPIGASYYEFITWWKRIHPMAHDWRSMIKDADRSTIEGKLFISDRSCRLLALIANLRVCQEKAIGTDRLLEFLKADPSAYRSTALEASAGANYLPSSYEVHYVKEAESPTVDIALARDTNKIGVECKSILDWPEEETPAWQEFADKLIRQLQTAKRSVAVRVHGRRKVDRNSLLRSLDTVNAEMGRNDEFKDDTVACRITTLCDWNTPLDDPQSILPPDCLSSWMYFISASNEGGQVRNLIVLGVTPFIPRDFTKKILRLIRTTKQMAADSANIMHIEIPTNSMAAFDTLWEDAFQPVADDLSKNHQRVNAIVLTGMMPNPNARGAEPPVKRLYRLIPNPDVRNPLPNDLQLPGSADQGIPPMGQVGRVEMMFACLRPIEEEVGRSFFNHCSRHGNNQLCLRLGLDGKLRVTCYSPSVGFLSLSGTPPTIEPGVQNNWSISWHGRSLFVTLNRRVILSTS